ncbi:hypothetical protein N657DRAFT_577109 [Parathielavia appendiculata]|uniref:MARVEL domain-containing protein n=1 Tax=Parathielavia appendiculata TaxID=2587402 RepID=A0AAN6TX99_9PEZI|nr:hypothetical protein N657DRAFT_577109 [Parathielavia appendiculata]
MKLTNISFPLMLLIRVTQGVFALLVLILSGFVAHWYNSSTSLNSPAQINYLIFTAIWSFLSLASIQLLPRFLPRTPKSYLTLPFDAATAVFSFAGFVALAVFLQGLLFCRGAPCHAAQADVAFAAFSFATWAASTALTALEMVRARRGGKAMEGGRMAGTGAVPMSMGTKEAAA